MPAPGNVSVFPVTGTATKALVAVQPAQKADQNVVRLQAGAVYW